MSIFDPNQFLDTPMDAGDTQYIPVPVGEYTAVITKKEIRQFPAKDDPTKVYTSLDITWEIDDANVKSLLGQDTVRVRQSLFLDITANGGIDMGKGKNVQLNRLREAIGANTGGFTFSQLDGKVAKVKVAHRVNKQTNEPIAEVAACAKLA